MSSGQWDSTVHEWPLLLIWGIRGNRLISKGKCRKLLLIVPRPQSLRYFSTAVGVRDVSDLRRCTKGSRSLGTRLRFCRLWSDRCSVDAEHFNRLHVWTKNFRFVFIVRVPFENFSYIVWTGTKWACLDRLTQCWTIQTGSFRRLLQTDRTSIVQQSINTAKYLVRSC